MLSKSTLLVSVIIPCFNAEQWLREAIDSVFKQTYSLIELIVIDDGSTDNSLDIIKSYSEKIIWETGPNRGGNHARNRGLALSKGVYIQYLDADDYLKPEKIQRQVEYLETTGDDVVYGDWQHQYHYPDGKVILDEVKISGNQSDILASLLSGWWVSPACLLFRRSSVEAAGVWDETLMAGQDKDFFLSVVASGAAVSYQPGCYSVYRRYGNVTVSTSSKKRYLENHIRILDKYQNRLLAEGKLLPHYKYALAQSFFVIARGYLDIERAAYDKYLKKAFSLSPHFQPREAERTRLYSILQKFLGFPAAEKFVIFLKDVRKRLVY